MNKNEKRKRGTVKRFINQKHYGFIQSEDDMKIYFVHESNIQMPGYRVLEECDVVTFIPVTTEDGRNVATDVKPVLTCKMVRRALAKEDYFMYSFRNVYGHKVWHIVDTYNFIQCREQGLYLQEVADWIGLDYDKETA